MVNIIRQTIGPKCGQMIRSKNEILSTIGHKLVFLMDFQSYLLMDFLSLD